MERYFRLHGANGKYWEMEEMEIQGGHGESEDIILHKTSQEGSWRHKHSALFLLSQMSKSHMIYSYWFLFQRTMGFPLIFWSFLFKKSKPKPSFMLEI